MREIAAIFADIDSKDPAAFVAHLTEDVTFRFGNNDPVHGRAAVEDAVGGYRAPVYAA
jgi:ketosteroid isomerase-like protein